MQSFKDCQLQISGGNFVCLGFRNYSYCSEDLPFQFQVSSMPLASLIHPKQRSISPNAADYINIIDYSSSNSHPKTCKTIRFIIHSGMRRYYAVVTSGDVEVDIYTAEDLDGGWK